MNGESRPFKGAAPETPAKASADKHTPTVAEDLRRRCAASYRLALLENGTRDPMVTFTDEISYSLDGCRAAYAYLKALGLANSDTIALLDPRRAS